MTRTPRKPAVPGARAPAERRTPRPRAALGLRRTDVTRHLELLGQSLGWTSVERDRAREEWETAVSGVAVRDTRGLSGAGLGPFLERLVAWSRTALERRPEAIESARLTLLTQIAEIVRETGDDVIVIERALALLRSAVAFENATLFLYDKSQEVLVPAASAGEPVDLIPDVRFELGGGLSSWVARTRRPVLLSELRGDEREGAMVSRPGSFLSVPLAVQQDLVGVLNVGHSRPGAFTAADRDLLSAAGAILAAALGRRLAREEAKRVAVTDELTGLKNRAHFESRVAEELEKAQRYGSIFSILVFDIDRFRALTQAYGREHANACLVSLSGLLRQVARRSDLLARFESPDGFGLLLPNAGPEEARAAADRLREAVHAHAFPRRRRVTVSVGVASCPHDAREAERLLAHALTALGDARPALRGAA
jgi:diguanylate cyclase (GGDEF)-like protein